MQMKGAELAPHLAAALKANSTCSDLNLTGCNLDDGMVEPLAAVLATNSTLTLLNLEANKVNNDGAVMISTALKTNRSLLTLNLLNQKGTRFGDTTLGEFTQTLEASNVTLLKIIWRLESRQSFRLTKMLTRNNDIDRRIKTGKEYESLMPEGALPFTPEMLAQVRHPPHPPHNPHTLVLPPTHPAQFDRQHPTRTRVGPRTQHSTLIPSLHAPDTCRRTTSSI